MTLLELLAELRWRGAHLVVRDGGLVVEAAAGAALDDALRARLRASEAALVRLLRGSTPELALRSRLGRGARAHDRRMRPCGCIPLPRFTPRKESTTCSISSRR